jgi:hypothetical protein
MRKKNLLYTKNKYILKLLPIVVTAWIEALVILGNKFLYACVKEVCHHWAQPRFDMFQLIIIDDLIEKSVEIHVKVLKLWSAVFNKFFGLPFEQNHLSLQMADHFALHCEHLFTHLTFYTIVLQFLHSLHFVRKLQVVGLSIAGHIINHSVEVKNKQYMASYVMVYNTMSHLAQPRMCELSPALTLFAKNKWRLLYE